MNRLPIDDVLPETVAKIRTHPVVILEAAPGAGKTTRVPPALLDAVEGEILVLEPRRLAARLSAERVAWERGEKTGETVGYQVRFEKVAGPRTRIRYVTEGLFLRLFLSDPSLSRIGCVVLDEFHERHVHTDVALGLARYVQAHVNPKLKLVVMSATLHTEILERAFPDAGCVLSEGRVFPVEIEHLAQEPPPTRTMEILVEDAVRALLKDPRCPGHVLVFLAGAAEIRRARAQLEDVARASGSDLLELRADLPVAEQQRVFDALPRRKIILSTNVAETSVTIDGVTGVVDTGLAKVAGHAAWSGMPTLELRKVSQASCAQRAGRAGRTSPGVCKRLFTRFDFGARPAFEKPEIQRLDLTQVVLEIASAGAHLRGVGGVGTGAGATAPSPPLSIETLPWLERPDPAAVEASSALLRQIGALDTEGNVTSLGRSLSEFPLHPRLSRILVEAKAQGCLGAAVGAVALLSEGMILKRGVEAPDFAHSDVHYQREILLSWLSRDRGAHTALVDPTTVRRVEGLARQLCSVLKLPIDALRAPVSEQALDTCLLAGFPDRVAKVRDTRGAAGGLGGPAGSGRGPGAQDGPELVMCQGGQAFLSRSSVARNATFLLALEAEESRGGTQGGARTLIRVASEVEPEVLLLSESPLLSEREEVVWDAAAERVRVFRRTLYGQLVLEESARPSPEAEQEALRKRMKADWPQPFGEEEARTLDYYKVRCALLREAGFELVLPDFSDSEEFDFLLLHICEGKKGYGEVRDKDLWDYAVELLPGDAARALEEYAPEKLTIGAGRKVRVHYEAGKPPWVASRLQDFFGTVRTPRIARGRVPVVVHLLAPNGQSVQVTQDLEGFWDRAYKEVRKELSRRYPRHSWPEDPRTAEPPLLHRRPNRPSG